MFCAGDATYDSCIGDSGGPIITSSGEQVGVVSFGDGCAKEGKPGVYSRISYVLPWIQETICANSADPPPYCMGNTQEDKQISTQSPTNESTSSPSKLPTQSPTLNPTTLTITSAPVSQASPAAATTSVKVTCGDSTLSFPVPSAPDIESCEWLSDGLSGYGSLCDIYDVAMACQETCGICDLLAKFKK
jgi:hypothetical protein